MRQPLTRGIRKSDSCPAWPESVTSVALQPF
jgi:hypothetical protein